MADKAPVRAVIVGAGHRSEWYANYALKRPDALNIVGVADPNPFRREAFRARFGFPRENCFESAQALAAGARIGDCAINGTMDVQHVPTSIPLIEAGYHLLIEKPFALNEDEMFRLLNAARAHNAKVMVCHVLRYAPFYQAIKREILAGALGEVYSIEASEYVSYHHMATCYVRGKWNRFDACLSGMLLAKSCHDLDIIMWLMGKKPARVSSFGGLYKFRPEKAPPGAGTRCLVDCAQEPECPYSARKMYIDNPRRWRFYVWDKLEALENPTQEDRIKLLKGDSPYGRCVYKCDNDCVDHQTLCLSFEDSSTASMNMIGGAGKDERRLHIVGDKAELFGVFEDGVYTVRSIDARPGAECALREERPLDNQDAGGHGGGDERLVEDFVRYIRGETVTPSLTSLEDSIYGHQAVFLAERSRETGLTQSFRAR